MPTADPHMAALSSVLSILSTFGKTFVVIGSTTAVEDQKTKGKPASKEKRKVKSKGDKHTVVSSLVLPEILSSTTVNYFGRECTAE